MSQCERAAGPLEAVATAEAAARRSGRLPRTATPYRQRPASVARAGSMRIAPGRGKRRCRENREKHAAAIAVRRCLARAASLRGIRDQGTGIGVCDRKPPRWFECERIKGGPTVSQSARLSEGLAYLATDAATHFDCDHLAAPRDTSHHLPSPRITLVGHRRPSRSLSADPRSQRRSRFLSQEEIAVRSQTFSGRSADVQRTFSGRSGHRDRTIVPFSTIRRSSRRCWGCRPTGHLQNAARNGRRNPLSLKAGSFRGHSGSLAWASWGRGRFDGSLARSVRLRERREIRIGRR